MTALDEDAIVGCLLGQAVGDALGLPMEGLSRRRGSRLYPHLDRYQFFFGYGMGSDDTEHACMTAQALLRSGGDPGRFRDSLGWRLRWWFLALPVGIGKATLKACVRLWLGWPPGRSGVKSAGNGPAMRAAILGACLDEPLRCATVLASTFVTHFDRQALQGALAVADAVGVAARSRGGPAPDGPELLHRCVDIKPFTADESELKANLSTASNELAAGRSVAELAERFGLKLGVTGYIAHTVPVALFAFHRHPDDFRTAVQSVIRCGGDTDTVAAITGALVGARVGKAGIPEEWVRKLADWPRSVAWIERLAKELAKGEWRCKPQPAVRLAWWAIPIRNLIFFLIVLLHVLRRILPPY
jgi:ADP-ribosylglycohydrolase